MNAEETMKTFDELRKRTAPNLVEVVRAVASPDKPINLTDLSAILALTNFATTEIPAALAKEQEARKAAEKAELSLTVKLQRAEKEIALLNSKLAHPAGKGRA